MESCQWAGRTERDPKPAVGLKLFEDATGADRARFNDGILDPRWSPDQALIRSYFKFTVVRNPWDRFVSGWKYCRSTRNRTLSDVLANLPRERIAENIFARDASLVSRGHYARALWRRQVGLARYAVEANLLGRDARKPQAEAHDFRHVTRQQVETVVWDDGRFAVDRVIFFEHLEEGMAALSRDIGLPLRELPRRKVKRRDDDYRKYFDDASLARFNVIFARDIAAWGYDFDTGQPDETWMIGGSGTFPLRPAP